MDPETCALIMANVISQDMSDHIHIWLEEIDACLKSLQEQRRRAGCEQDEEEIGGGGGGAGDGGATDIAEEAVQPDYLPKAIDQPSHLFWLMLSHAAASYKPDTLYDENASRVLCQELTAQISVPAHANFDDFFAIVKQTFYSQPALREAFVRVLREFDEAMQSYDPLAYSRDTIQLDVLDIRQKMTALFAKQLCPDGAAALEDGCYLYALMFATVDSKNDQLSDTRWRECYLAKCRAVNQFCSSDAAAVLRGHLEQDPETALLVAFTPRRELFAHQRSKIEGSLQKRLIADKRNFDVENDHSGVKSDFKCPKCGSFQTQTFLIQLRRADEPMTQFWKCWSCMKQGREN